MFKKLKVLDILTSELVNRCVVKYVKRNLDAFAASGNDFVRTSVITHIFITGNALLFKHKLRLIPFALLQNIEQELEKLLAVKAISLATHGECPYASRTEIVQKKMIHNVCASTSET